MVIERVSDIHQRHRRTGCGHPVGQRGSHLGQSLNTLAADHQGAHRGNRPGLGLAHLGCLLKHDMGVGATEPKGRHTCPTRASGIRPLGRVVNDLQSKLIEGDM